MSCIHQVDLMQETVERCYENEEKKGGLVVRKALYGKLHGEDLRWVWSLGSQSRGDLRWVWS